MAEKGLFSVKMSAVSCIFAFLGLCGGIGPGSGQDVAELRGAAALIQHAELHSAAIDRLELFPSRSSPAPGADVATFGGHDLKQAAGTFPKTTVRAGMRGRSSDHANQRYLFWSANSKMRAQNASATKGAGRVHSEVIRYHAPGATVAMHSSALVVQSGIKLVAKIRSIFPQIEADAESYRIVAVQRGNLNIKKCLRSFFACVYESNMAEKEKAAPSGSGQSHDLLELDLYMKNAALQCSPSRLPVFDKLPQHLNVIRIALHETGRAGPASVLNMEQPSVRWIWNKYIQQVPSKNQSFAFKIISGDLCDVLLPGEGIPLLLELSFYEPLACG